MALRWPFKFLLFFIRLNPFSSTKMHSYSLLMKSDTNTLWVWLTYITIYIMQHIIQYLALKYQPWMCLYECALSCTCWNHWSLALSDVFPAQPEGHDTGGKADTVDSFKMYIVFNNLLSKAGTRTVTIAIFCPDFPPTFNGRQTSHYFMSYKIPINSSQSRSGLTQEQASLNKTKNKTKTPSGFSPQSHILFRNHSQDATIPSSCMSSPMLYVVLSSCCCFSPSVFVRSHLILSGCDHQRAAHMYDQISMPDFFIFMCGVPNG